MKWKSPSDILLLVKSQTSSFILCFKRLLEEKAKTITGIHQWPFRALARSFEVIPRTLIQNCGANVIRTLTALRSKHSQDGNASWGVDGDNGNLVDMKVLGIWEPLAVKQQTYKTAIEVLFMSSMHFAVFKLAKKPTFPLLDRRVVVENRRHCIGHKEGIHSG